MSDLCKKLKSTAFLNTTKNIIECEGKGQKVSRAKG